jgi:FKBP-type peptidyl-prolyl cis-trans isomerase FkpA
MKYTFRLIGFLVFLTLLSCGRMSKYPGYKKAEHGIYYRLHKIGENTVNARPGDYITVNLGYATLSDSVFFKGTRKLQVNQPAFEGAIDECFIKLAEGDSASFILNADDFFAKTLQTSRPRFIPPGGPVIIHVAMQDIQTEEEYENEKEAFLSWIEDFGDYEKVLLKQFLSSEKLPVSPLPSGIFYLNINPGTGKKVEIGDTITINYEGRFLNGKFFDSTIRRRQPFQFVYGTEWQVIKGLEEAIGMMREGERSLFILPSELGFGNQGSSTGIIPPFTSLIFEVEILKVSSPGKI